jgi:hypothetical protein
MKLIKSGKELLGMLREGYAPEVMRRPTAYRFQMMEPF